jgi:NAD(P)-dependent dehydrogenase (short-subunit alcohol dehydrogenase family)
MYSYNLSGIGLAFVKQAIAATAKVLIADLRLTDDAETFIKSVPANQLAFVKTDVAKRAELENLITFSENVFHDVPDVYIAAAGVFEPVSVPYMH